MAQGEEIGGAASFACSTCKAVGGSHDRGVAGSPSLCRRPRGCVVVCRRRWGLSKGLGLAGVLSLLVLHVQAAFIYSAVRWRDPTTVCRGPLPLLAQRWRPRRVLPFLAPWISQTRTRGERGGQPYTQDGAEEEGEERAGALLRDMDLRVAQLTEPGPPTPVQASRPLPPLAKTTGTSPAQTKGVKEHGGRIGGKEVAVEGEKERGEGEEGGRPMFELEVDLEGGGQREKRRSIQGTQGAQGQGSMEDGPPPLLNSLIGSLDLSAGAVCLSSPAPPPPSQGGGLSSSRPGVLSRLFWWGVDRVSKHVDLYEWGERALSRVATMLNREILFGVMAIFGRELFMREVAVQIEALPLPVQAKASRLMNQTMENLQDKLGVVLSSGVSWETVLRLVQTELRALSKEGIDPLTESVARELLFFAARKVFPDLPLEEWNRNVETLSDKTRKALLEYQIRMDVLLNPDGSPLPQPYNPSLLPAGALSPSNSTKLAEAIQRWLKPPSDEPSAKLVALGRRLEKLTSRTLEEIMLEVEGEIRYVATGGKPEVAARHIARSLGAFAGEYGQVVKDVWAGNHDKTTPPPQLGTRPNLTATATSTSTSSAASTSSAVLSSDAMEAELAATFAQEAKRRGRSNRALQDRHNTPTPTQEERPVQAELEGEEEDLWGDQGGGG